jgi:hypothetical protein
MELLEVTDSEHPELLRFLDDLIIPLDPSSPPRIALRDLQKYRRSYRCLSHMLVNHGLPARDDLAGVDKPDTVAMLVAAEKAWLQGGSTAAQIVDPTQANRLK